MGNNKKYSDEWQFFYYIEFCFVFLFLRNQNYGLKKIFTYQLCYDTFKRENKIINVTFVKKYIKINMLIELEINVINLLKKYEIKSQIILGNWH